MTEADRGAASDPSAEPITNGVLTDEDSADIFFSFDITAMAYVWEQEHAGEEGAGLTRIQTRHRPGDMTGIGAALAAWARDFFRHPTNWAYVLISLLLMVMLIWIEPLSKKVEEELVSMLPPEFDLPKPPPPPPPPPPEEPPPPPEPEPEPEPEPIPEEPLELPEEKPKLHEELDKKVEMDRREKIEMPGVKVEARKSDHVVADLPKAFGNTNRREGDTIPTSLSNIGTRRTGPATGAGGPQVKIGPKQRRKTVDAPAEAVPIAKKGTGRGELTEDGLGLWEKIENVGPLAHLNERCYAKPAGSLVYVSIYKLRCRDNQIIEAWKKK